MEISTDNFSEFEFDDFGLYENDTCDDSCQEFIVGFWIEGVIVPIVAVFGILGKSIVNYCKRCLQRSKNSIDLQADAN